MQTRFFASVAVISYTQSIQTIANCKRVGIERSGLVSANYIIGSFLKYF
jgi:hypothetical protein